MTLRIAYPINNSFCKSENGAHGKSGMAQPFSLANKIISGVRLLRTELYYRPISCKLPRNENSVAQPITYHHGMSALRD